MITSTVVYFKIGVLQKSLQAGPSALSSKAADYDDGGVNASHGCDAALQ